MHRKLLKKCIHQCVSFQPISWRMGNRQFCGPDGAIDTTMTCSPEINNDDLHPNSYPQRKYLCGTPKPPLTQS